MTDSLNNESDIVVPFLFENLPVRGALIQLKSSWARMQLGQSYSQPLSSLLGQASAATVLIAQSLKFRGGITLQISGDSKLSMLVVQCSNKLELRGMASADDSISQTTPYSELVANSRCAITVDAGVKERPYQGIVAMQGDSLADSLEHYFSHSAQVESHVVLLASPHLAGGILLQQMPSENAPLEDDWIRLGMLAKTLTLGDFTDGIGPKLLGHLFAEDDVRLFDSRPVAFRCRCSRERAAEVLRLLGEDETTSALEEQGHVKVSCEYCGQQQRFDAVDVRRLFAGQSMTNSKTLH